MRLRFALAALLPALLSLAVMALVADRLARRALDDEVSARLVVAAKAAAAALPAERVVRLEAGQEGSRTYGHLRARLLPVARATGTRLIVVKPDRTALVDSEGRMPIGEPVPALERDRFEIAEAAAGRAMASQVLFEGSDGRLYKTGYAPLSDPQGKVVAVVGADGTAASFATLRRFRRLLGTVAIAGAVLGALVAALASLSVTRPLTRLTEAARRIARGDLETPLWRRARRDEIGTLRDTLEEMRRALRARDEERETLLAGIAHEVRNPLGALDLFAGLLAEELQGRAQAPHVARIQSELAALSKVVEEFLDYARARPPLREPVDLRIVLAEVADLAAPLAAQRQVSIAVEGEGEAKADREQLRRALLNLVRNAVEAAPAASEVEVAARVADGEAHIEVRDRGPGLAAEARASLFRPFFTTKEKGTGLGLALAKKVADAHGGTLSLEQRDGGGTIARLALPADSARPHATLVRVATLGLGSRRS
ncbi:HAMP domain-containing sensor histidine kinase [Anaeromyxobacter sp. Fw109-5]|uniref:sensor histidine kinase n=1 Tax=Anaeromyxobacter sp. (strain Fw109-5) TaxID=404589 RepID=UPI0000ED6E0B|nr:HAMP domain-containing sensor histidine kinase [Anaeromyxobacter sp. Fw109-5]ABS28573.1 histidine kinase [Anaeromyxobacter sp. Fw109-5]